MVYRDYITFPLHIRLWGLIMKAGFIPIAFASSNLTRPRYATDPVKTTLRPSSSPNSSRRVVLLMPSAPTTTSASAVVPSLKCITLRFEISTVVILWRRLPKCVMLGSTCLTNASSRMALRGCQFCSLRKG